MFKKQWNSFINNFSTNKVLIIKDKKLSLSTKFLQLFVIAFLITDLMVRELYQKVEVPSGYTSMWAESNNLYDYRNTTQSYCNNPNYNYIYSNPDWRYTNISCVDLDYSEMYVKGENEIFYLTHFTEHEVNITNYDKNTVSKKDYFTRGVEGMQLAFDHFFSTSFTEGGNVAVKKVRTHIRDCHDKYDAYLFQPGETVKLSISEWLNLACVNLEDFNYGTSRSLADPLVKNDDYPKYRLTGIDFLIKIQYYNMKSVSGYNSEECIIKVLVNDGWASKGSTINYIEYPSINGEYKNHYVDRYKYGIKFKFLVSGLMGTFDTYNLVTHFVSGKVLIDLCATLVVIFATTFFAKYSKKFSGERVSKVNKPENNNEIKRIDSEVSDKIEGEISNDVIENLNIEIEDKRISLGGETFKVSSI